MGKTTPVDIGNGKAIARNSNGELSVQDKQPTQWSEEGRKKFLDHLAATANVQAAAVEGGVHFTTVYRIRRQDPAFAAAWEDARNHALATIKTMLAAKAMGTDRYKPEEAVELDSAKLDTDLALKLIEAQERAAARAQKQQGGPVPPVQAASEEEACAEILKRLKVLNIRLNAPKG